LFDRVARTPLQSGLQEVRFLFELLRFLLRAIASFLLRATTHFC
jgi:hypothetical protein